MNWPQVRRRRGPHDTEELILRALEDLRTRTSGSELFIYDDGVRFATGQLVAEFRTASDRTQWWEVGFPAQDPFGPFELAQLIITQPGFRPHFQVVGPILGP